MGLKHSSIIRESPMSQQQTEDRSTTTALSKQCFLYDRAIGIASGLQMAHESNGKLIELQEILDEIATCPTNELLSGELSPEGRALARGLRSRIEQLLGIINGAEQRFRDAHTPLVPKAKREVTRRRMLDAYGGK